MDKIVVIGGKALSHLGILVILRGKPGSEEEVVGRFEDCYFCFGCDVACECFGNAGAIRGRLN